MSPPILSPIFWINDLTLPRIHFDPNFLQLAKITYNPLVYIYTSGLGQFLKKSTDILEKYGIFSLGPTGIKGATDQMLP